MEKMDGGFLGALNSAAVAASEEQARAEAEAPIHYVPPLKVRGAPHPCPPVPRPPFPPGTPLCCLRGPVIARDSMHVGLGGGWAGPPAALPCVLPPLSS